MKRCEERTSQARESSSVSAATATAPSSASKLAHRCSAVRSAWCVGGFVSIASRTRERLPPPGPPLSLAITLSRTSTSGGGGGGCSACTRTTPKTLWSLKAALDGSRASLLPSLGVGLRV